jgi:hypothetical protein
LPRLTPTSLMLFLRFLVCSRSLLARSEVDGRFWDLRPDSFMDRCVRSRIEYFMRTFSWTSKAVLRRANQLPSQKCLGWCPSSPRISFPFTHISLSWSEFEYHPCFSL